MIDSLKLPAIVLGLFVTFAVLTHAAITITSPAAYQVIQRSGTTADIDIAGTYSGSPTAIEARWNGGSWVTIDASPSGGTFSGTLPDQAQGQGTLECRFTNDVGEIDSNLYVGIGEVFLCAGQSNMSGRGTSNQTYSHARFKAGLFHNDMTWKELTDPYDDATGQVDTVSSDTGPAAAGSVMPIIATELMESLRVPVAFIPAAKGGTSITVHLPAVDHLDRTTLYGSANYRAQQQPEGIRAVLWWQGETDAVAAMTQATYNGHLDTLANAFAADLGVPLISCLLQNSSGITNADEQKIRDAVTEASGDNANVLGTVDLSDIGTDDSFHLQTTAKLQDAGFRWAKRITKEFGGMIPAGRLPLANTWETAGVEGGIPSAGWTIFADVVVDYSADNTGATDATSDFQTAIDACPDDQVVFVPAGTYRIDGVIDLASKMVLRGAGQGTTTLDLRNRIDFGPAGLKFPIPHLNSPIAVTGGATAGSTSITCAATTDAAIGRLIYITGDDDYPRVWKKTTSANSNLEGSTHRITSFVTNTSIDFEPPLPMDYTNAEFGIENKPPGLEAGLESMTLDCTNMTSSSSFGVLSFVNCWDCWAYDLELDAVPDKTAVVIQSGRIELRKLYCHDTRGRGSNTEGLTLGGTSSWCLIVDNRLEIAGFPSIVIGDSQNYGNVGNVIAYNYVVNSIFQSSGDHMQPSDISLSHNGHGRFNLVEGNYCGKLESDSFHASTSDNTVLRNVFTGENTNTDITHKTCVRLQRRSSNNSLIGNVLGPVGTARDHLFVTTSGWTSTQDACYSLGYPNQGNTGWANTYPPTDLHNTEPADDNTKDLYIYRDTETYGTTIIEGNYDPNTAGQLWSITPETIPNSYYLTEKPDWFFGLVWPPVNPANPVSSNPAIIPAGYRALNGGADPPATLTSATVTGTLTIGP